MLFFNSKRLSCGVVIVNADRELLLCHVTGKNQWDLPKGGIDAGETPLQAALRETREETGLRLAAGTLLDLGCFRYTAKKNLHLFGTCMPRFDIKHLACESHFLDRYSGRQMPEMDGYGWFGFERVDALCTPNLAAVLGSQIGLTGLLARLTQPPQAALAAA